MANRFGDEAATTGNRFGDMPASLPGPPKPPIPFGLRPGATFMESVANRPLNTAPGESMTMEQEIPQGAVDIAAGRPFTGLARIATPFALSMPFAAGGGAASDVGSVAARTGEAARMGVRTAVNTPPAGAWSIPAMLGRIGGYVLGHETGGGLAYPLSLAAGEAVGRGGPKVGGFVKGATENLFQKPFGPDLPPGGLPAPPETPYLKGPSIPDPEFEPGGLKFNRPASGGAGQAGRLSPPPSVKPAMRDAESLTPSGQAAAEPPTAPEPFKVKKSIEKLINRQATGGAGQVGRLPAPSRRGVNRAIQGEASPSGGPSYDPYLDEVARGLGAKSFAALDDAGKETAMRVAAAPSRPTVTGMTPPPRPMTPPPSVEPVTGFDPAAVAKAIKEDPVKAQALKDEMEKAGVGAKKPPSSTTPSTQPFKAKVRRTK